MQKSWPQPMKEEIEHQGWNAKQKRCREPTRWLNRCNVLHDVSVPDSKTQLREKSAADSGRSPRIALVPLYNLI